MKIFINLLFLSLLGCQVKVIDKKEEKRTSIFILEYTFKDFKNEKFFQKNSYPNELDKEYNYPWFWSFYVISQQGIPSSYKGFKDPRHEHFINYFTIVNLIPVSLEKKMLSFCRLIFKPLSQLKRHDFYYKSYSFLKRIFRNKIMSRQLQKKVLKELELERDNFFALMDVFPFGNNRNTYLDLMKELSKKFEKFFLGLSFEKIKKEISFLSHYLLNYIYYGYSINEAIVYYKKLSKQEQNKQLSLIIKGIKFSHNEFFVKYLEENNMEVLSDIKRRRKELLERLE